MADTEEVKKEEVAGTEPESKEPEQKEYTEIEQKALDQGWNPNWKGSDEEFIDAAEFVRRKPLFDKIESQKRFYDKKLKDVEATLNQLAQHHTKVKEVEYQRALKDLKQAKREALKEGDTNAVLDFEDRMEELTETHQQEIQEIKAEQAVQTAQGPSAEFQVWVKSNSWYLSNEEMHDFADGTAQAYVNRERAKGNSLTENEIFEYVVGRVKKAYPEQFSNPNRERPSAVTNGDRQGKGTPKGLPKLPPEYEDIARNFEKNGVMTRAEYTKQLSEMGVI
jgi:hypothetical protein